MLSKGRPSTPLSRELTSSSKNVKTFEHARQRSNNHPRKCRLRPCPSFPLNERLLSPAAFFLFIGLWTLVAVSASASEPISFNAAINFRGGGLDFTSVAVGDFNADGNPDFAVASQFNPPSFFNGCVFIYSGKGDGTFGPSMSFAAGSYPYSIAVADFNADGKLESLTTNSNNVSILLGNGDGTFGAASDFPAGNSLNSIVAGDFNGDGKQDLAVTNRFNNSISVLLETGTGRLDRRLSLRESASRTPSGSGILTGTES